ncbi:MAG: hypothetical protein KatS3mg129_2167 [Leptospiraceae bacterium]|nr:MAG: hypothetical protein KatS3mg129_2167 [Leptospiraceae bacterium]
MTEPTDGTSVGPGDQNPTNHTDSFLATNPPKADFLFVINNSATMVDEINYVKDNITTFVNRLNTFNIDFMAGTIMTDSSKLRGLDMPNPRGDNTYGFTNDIAKIQLDVQVGAGGGTSSGSYHDSKYYVYESCVYFAEKALSSTNPDPNNTISGVPNLGNGLGDIGSVLSEGYPRSGASLTIICVTDDDDIYTHWDNTNCPDSNCSTTQPDGNAIDPPEFDVNNNLFVQYNYKFYFIMPLTSTGEKGDCSGPGSSSGTNYYADDLDGLSGSLQYDDSRRVDMIALANKTGGGYSSICSANYGAYLSKIVDDIASNASTYTLTYTPISSTIRVFINGTEIPKTANPGTGQTGYIYDSSTNKISFTGTLPAAGSSIQVSYFHY